MDRLADITTLLATYAFGYDTGDWRAVGECFQQDGVFVLRSGSTGEEQRFEGREAVMDLMRQSLDGQNDRRRHFSTNLRIIQGNASTVRVGSYLLLGAVDSQGFRIVQSGRYEDLISLVGKPAFIERQLTMDGEF